MARAAELCAEGHFAEASDLLRPVAEREPANRDMWRLLARADLGAGRFERALQAAEHVRALAACEAFADVIASVALLRLGRTNEALEHARGAVASDPRDFDAVSLLARLLSTVGLHDEAQVVAADAVDLAREEPAAHLTAGVVAAAAGRRELARASFRRVLALDPANGQAHHELARLRLRHRVNDPATLADAASGFARAAHPGFGSPKSIRSLEKVLRAFLSKTAYLLFLDTYLVARVASASSGTAARLLPVALLAVPGYYAARFLRRLTPMPRQRLAWLLLGEHALTSAVALEIVAAASIFVGAVGGDAVRSGAAVLVAVAALAARLTLYLARERAGREASGEDGEHAIRTSLIWIIAALLALLASVLIVAAVIRGRPGAAVGALVSLGATGALARVAISRRVPG
ncbi:MAG TPA: tetratricopeptide repeat protein [Solirubrobacteraceae bacterium]|nr:tetratricopeptide repeat protein [Solirubrobacteraceae bacterium]